MMEIFYIVVQNIKHHKNYNILFILDPKSARWGRIMSGHVHCIVQEGFNDFATKARHKKE